MTIAGRVITYVLSYSLRKYMGITCILNANGRVLYRYTSGVPPCNCLFRREYVGGNIIVPKRLFKHSTSWEQPIERERKGDNCGAVTDRSLRPSAAKREWRRSGGRRAALERVWTEAAEKEKRARQFSVDSE